MVYFLLLLQGNSLWHPQWIMQIRRHPGKHHLRVFRWDHQSGPHPSGGHFSRWGWPDCSSTARDSRTGPDVNHLLGKGNVGRTSSGNLNCAHTPCLSLSSGHLDSAGGRVEFVTPSLAPISAVYMFVTQVTDSGVS